MGINGLYKIIKDNAPDAVETVSPGDMNGWCVAIDASLAIYQWCTVGRARHIVNAEGKFINHIQGAFFRTVALLSAGIIPVYVFDGPSPAAKETVLEARRSTRVHSIPREVFVEVQRLLNHMGVPVIISPSEAEAQAAAMTHTVADAVATEDMDALAFGAKCMIRGLDTGSVATRIDLARVLDGLSMTRETFVDMCILAGCDYTRTVPGIGPTRARTLMQKYKSIEALFAAGKYKAPPDFDYVAARELFMRPHVAAVAAPRVRRLSRVDIDRLREYLLGHGLVPARIEKTLTTLSVL